MKRVYIELREFSNMRHIIRTERDTHIINTAARESNIYHIVRDGRAAEKPNYRQKGIVIPFEDYT